MRYYFRLGTSCYLSRACAARDKQRDRQFLIRGKVSGIAETLLLAISALFRR